MFNEWVKIKWCKRICLGVKWLLWKEIKMSKNKMMLENMFGSQMVALERNKRMERKKM